MLSLEQWRSLQAGVQSEQDVKLLLEQARPTFRTLLQFPGPSRDEKEALESGRFEGFQISQEFKVEALFLSSQLQLSESACSNLLIAAKQSNIQRGIAEVAVLLFYQQRQAILASLLTIVQKADSTTDYAHKQALLSVIQEWDQQLFLKEIDRLQAEAAAIHRQCAQPGQGTTFAMELQKHRIECILKERKTFAQIIHALASAGFLNIDLPLALVQWLSTKNASNVDQDSTILYVLIATMTALDPLQANEELFNQISSLKKLHKHISESKWSSEQLRATVLLQWTLFFSNACQNNPALEQETQVWEETIEKDVYQSLKLDALTFILNNLLDFRRQAPLQLIAFDADFQPAVLQQLESTTDTFISTMHTVLKKIKNKEEDARAGLSYRKRPATGQSQVQGEATQRHDTATLFLLLQLLYRDRPDAGYKFWVESEDGDRRLNAFLKWASDSRDTMATAFLEMLAALSCGEQSASQAHQFLSANSNIKGTLCSYATLFGAISHYAHEFSSGPGIEEMSPNEVESLQALARLLTVVVTSSPAAKAVLVDNQMYKPISTIFSLLIFPIHLGLKGDLLQCIAAFSQPGPNRALSLEIAKRCWTELEQRQILPTWSRAESGRIEGGIVNELEAVEVPSEEYPLSTAFLQLLTSLVHPIKPISGAAPAFSFPENLGSPQRRPGLSPYVSFVVDTVFLPLSSRKFKSEVQRWDIAKQCLLFMTNSLQSLSLQPLTGKANVSLVHLLLQQPGFDLLMRFLSAGPLLPALVDIASTRLDDILQDTCVANKVVTVKLSLQLLLDLHRISPMFVDLIVPNLAEQSLPAFDKPLILQAVQTLDEALLILPQIAQLLPRIATLINCDPSTRIPALVADFLTALSLSRGFSVADSHYVSAHRRGRINRLVGFLSESDESERIANGFCGQLRSADDSTQQAILTLLTQNLQEGATFPNIAHYLLGFTFTSENIQNVTVNFEEGRAMLAAVVDIVETLEGQPSLIEQAYRTIFQLVSHQYTSQVAIRWLRTQTDFFLKSLGFLPFSLAQVSSSDHSLLLQAQAWLLRSVALEFNELVREQSTERINRMLVALLFVRDNEEIEGDVIQTEQSLSCMLELLHALTLEEIGEPTMQDFSHLALLPVNAQTCLKIDASDLALYDLEKVQLLIDERQRELHAQSQLKSFDQQQQFTNEAESITAQLKLENEKIRSQAARLQFLQGWNNVLDLILLKGISYLSTTDRFSLLMDILETIISLLDTNYFPNEHADALSAAAVMVMTCYREEQMTQGSVGPTDRLPGIFKVTIHALLTPGVTTASRGHLFCVLSHFCRMPPANGPDLASKFNHALASDLGRLLQLACRDALYADQVWQLLAFAFLDSLCATITSTIPASKLLSHFSKHNFIHNVISSLKSEEKDVLACLAPDPESLNAIFVFEAKMSFLMRVASSADGVDAITDAHFLSCIGQWEFLSVPMYQEQSMALDQDTFFPSVYQRYQQILLPTLHFLSAYTARLAAKHATDRIREIFAFVLAHRDSFISVLHQMVSAPTLRLMEQCGMILAILTLTATCASPNEFASPSSFGGIHSAVLTVTGTILDPSLADRIVPSTEQEAVAAQEYPAKSDKSLFEVSKASTSIDVLRSLLSYLYAVSSAGGKVRPVLTSDANEYAGATGRYPSMASCLNFVRRETHTLSRLLSELDRSESMPNGRPLDGSSTDVLTRLHLVEMALLLFLRHAQFYYNKGSTQSAASLNAAQSLTTIQTSFNVVAGRLQELPLSTGLATLDGRAHQLLIASMLRCCTDVLS